MKASKASRLFISAVIVIILCFIGLILIKVLGSRPSSQDTSSLDAQPQESTASSPLQKANTEDPYEAGSELFQLWQSQSPIERALGAFNYNDLQAARELKEIGQECYGADFLAHQGDIVQLLRDKNLIYHNFGYAFLPDQPASHTPLSESGYQLDVPLMLQSDPRWARLPYGSLPEDTMRLGGCALVSLAMVESYLVETSVSPVDILDWSGNDYWVGDEGTSWQIFEDFAEAFGHAYTNHQMDFAAAMEAIRQGEVVVASINPGYITPVGHILVIRGYDPVNHLVYINDPNDNPVNMFSIQGLSEDYFHADAINYWAFGSD